MKRTSILICFLFAIAANSFIAAKAQVNTTDSLALVDLYNSTDGVDWHHHDNWLTTAPVHTWYGVFMNDNGTRVNMLDMYTNHLHGHIPASIGNLTALTSLYLEHNQLNGTIPAEIGNLVKLTVIRLDQNNLGGSIPASIGNLTKLTELILYLNNLKGTIPSSIGNLVNMKELDLYQNQLSGTIPPSLGNLKKVKILSLDNNHLRGKIPSKLGNLAQLQSLGLNNNNLQGTIPNSFHKLSHLSNAYFSYNQLSQYGNDTFPVSQSIIFFIDHNRFTFDGIESSVHKFFGSQEYAPQATLLSAHRQGNILSVYAGGTLSNNTYHWYKAGTKDSTTITADSTFQPATGGKYYVTVTNAVVTGLTLYSDTINFVMPVATQTQTLITKAVQSSTGNKPLRVYPNPAKDIIHIQTNGTATIILTNSAGKILFSKSINNDSEINVSSFANGVYYIQNKTTGETQKIVVVH